MASRSRSLTSSIIIVAMALWRENGIDSAKLQPVLEMPGIDNDGDYVNIDNKITFSVV